MTGVDCHSCCHRRHLCVPAGQCSLRSPGLTLRAAFVLCVVCCWLQVRFVVMANIFVTDLQIHRRYDIKGSTDGRTVGPAGRTK